MSFLYRDALSPALGKLMNYNKLYRRFDGSSGSDFKKGSGLFYDGFWSTAGSVVKNWVVVRVEKYAPKLLEPQFQTMLTLTAFFGIIYFGMKLRGSSKGLTIPSMIDLSEASVDA